ncbi:MAG: ABC transporter permease [Gemmatimonadetes bacterium]|nr:ABC transporter permease [Gemmatimonadota bacterium]
METIVVALAAIRANVLRSVLTMLGIIIGVAAVITMVALGSGAQAAIEEQIQALGTDRLSIYPGQSFHRGVASSSRVSLTTDDAAALAADAPALRAVVPELSSNFQIKYGSRNANIRVVATTPEYVTVNNMELVAGRNLGHGDGDARRRVAVLGSAVPEMVDANGEAMIGQELVIRGLRFEVIGLLAEKGGQGFSNPDERILIPLETGQYRVHGSDRLGSITAQVLHPDSITVAMIGIEGVLRREHGIRPGADNDFQIRTGTEFLTTAQEATETFTFLLAGIAAVSLLVGGIGIMNIMLVSVTERTREIGLRKAVGARRSNIMYQFLVEALTLCMLGGVIGVIVGAGGAEALHRFKDWNTLVSPRAVALAFAFSAAVGVFFGMWPARRAARLDPIEALRHE